MRTRLFPLVVTLTCALALVGASCAGDDEESGATTSTTEAVPDAEPTTTVSEEEFTAGVADIRSQLDNAGDDACGVLAIVATAGNDLGTRTDPAALRQLAELQVAFLRALAGTQQIAAAGTGDAMRQLADELAAEAQAADFSMESLQNPTALQNPQFMEALTSVQQIGSECNVVPGNDPTATTVP
jgi:hypothetical protein